MSSVSTSNLVVTRAGYPALANSTFDLPKNHFTILTGNNGSGKTTLLKAICGILSPSRGTVSIGSNSSTANATGQRELRSKTIYVGHNALFMRHITVLEHLNLCKQLDVTNEPEKEYVLAVDQAIEMLDLGLRTSVRVEDLSAGQQRRVHLASALVRTPELVCVDEPHSSLDSKSKDLLDQIFARQHELGRTFLIATHDPHRLEDVATHEIELKNGVATLFDRQPKRPST